MYYGQCQYQNLNIRLMSLIGAAALWRWQEPPTGAVLEGVAQMILWSALIWEWVSLHQTQCWITLNITVNCSLQNYDYKECSSNITKLLCFKKEHLKGLTLHRIMHLEAHIWNKSSFLLIKTPLQAFYRYWHIEMRVDGMFSPSMRDLHWSSWGGPYETDPWRETIGWWNFSTRDAQQSDQCELTSLSCGHSA